MGDLIEFPWFFNRAGVPGEATKDVKVTFCCSEFRVKVWSADEHWAFVEFLGSERLLLKLVLGSCFTTKVPRPADADLFSFASATVDCISSPEGLLLPELS